MQSNRLPLPKAAPPVVKNIKMGNKLVLTSCGWVGKKTREQTLLVLSPREAVGFEEKEDCEPLANPECPCSFIPLFSGNLIVLHFSIN
jgi:hypothetical protein